MNLHHRLVIRRPEGDPHAEKHAAARRTTLDTKETRP